MNVLGFLKKCATIILFIQIIGCSSTKKNDIDYICFYFCGKPEFNRFLSTEDFKNCCFRQLNFSDTLYIDRTAISKTKVILDSSPTLPEEKREELIPIVFLSFADCEYFIYENNQCDIFQKSGKRTVLLPNRHAYLIKEMVGYYNYLSREELMTDIGVKEFGSHNIPDKCNHSTMSSNPIKPKEAVTALIVPK